MWQLRLALGLSALVACVGLGWATKPGWGLALAGVTGFAYALLLHDWNEGDDQ